MVDEHDDRHKPLYMISVVAEMVEVHPQTLREYERLGLVRPRRYKHIRMFSDADIERIRQILRLRDELGVNLAGIEVILKLLDRIDELQQEVERIRARRRSAGCNAWRRNGEGVSDAKCEDACPCWP